MNGQNQSIDNNNNNNNYCIYRALNLEKKFNSKRTKFTDMHRKVVQKKGGGK